MQNPWGDEQTQYFYELTPDKIFQAFDSIGLRSTGRCSTMFSMENRVYDVELQLPDTPKHRWEHHRIVKFYRPGRWSQEQIQEEHDFLNDLCEAEVPVIAPLALSDNQTLVKDSATELFFTLFPRVGGRTPDEFSLEQIPQVARFMARMHAVGSKKTALHRMSITPETYGLNHLDTLLSGRFMPNDLHAEYKATVESICQMTAPWFEETTFQRIHGDCHKGNILMTPEGATWLDFDDMLMGPCVQDMWLLIPGFEKPGIIRDTFLEAYESMFNFDYKSLRLIEPLRALRYIHFSSWIAKRWDDPVFPATFPHFNERGYWVEQLNDLKEQLHLIEQIAKGPSHL
ncbi:MAG: serine/threonine protein kinase [Oligoflexales bacterium]